MGMDQEIHEMMSNGREDGQKMTARGQQNEQVRRAASQKYGGQAVNSIERMASQAIGTRQAMGQHANDEHSKTRYRKQTIVTKDEPAYGLDFG